MTLDSLIYFILVTEGVVIFLVVGVLFVCAIWDAVEVVLSWIRR
jgi:hypothetical protein